MNTIDKLKTITADFFESFWNDELGIIPTWSAVWKFDGPVPNKDNKGCYAHLIGDEVVYIGLAVGNSHGIDEGSGIGQRVSKYWVKNTDGASQYMPSVHAPDITGIITIPFKENYWFAAALEIYLIKMMKQGLKNKIHNRN